MVQSQESRGTKPPCSCSLCWGRLGPIPRKLNELLGFGHSNHGPFSTRKLPPFWHKFASGSLHRLSPFCDTLQRGTRTLDVPHAPSHLPARTDQLVRNLVHDVGVIQSAALVLPPALDVDAGLLLKVRQVKVVPARGGRRRSMVVSLVSHTAFPTGEYRRPGVGERGRCELHPEEQRPQLS